MRRYKGIKWSKITGPMTLTCLTELDQGIYQFLPSYMLLVKGTKCMPAATELNELLRPWSWLLPLIPWPRISPL